jgi:hypothetical protein
MYFSVKKFERWSREIGRTSRNQLAVRAGRLEHSSMDLGRTFIAAGAVLIAIGLAWPWLRALNLGRLPGDIVIDRPGTHIYFPIATCLLLSVFVTLLFWILRK